MRAFYCQIGQQYRRTRAAILAGGVVYIASAGVLHFFIGSLADWIGTLAPLIGREQTLAPVGAQYGRVMPAMFISYAGMLLMIIGSLYALITNKTCLPRRMFVFHMIVWQLVLVIIPDIRQALGAAPSTWDFVISQGSGNLSLAVWMLANAIWAGRQMRVTEVK